MKKVTRCEQFFGRDGCGGSVGALAVADRAELPEGWAGGRAAADATGDDAAHLLPAELVLSVVRVFRRVVYIAIRKRDGWRSFSISRMAAARYC